MQIGAGEVGLDKNKMEGGCGALLGSNAKERQDPSARCRLRMHWPLRAQNEVARPRKTSVKEWALRRCHWTVSPGLVYYWPSVC